MACIRILLLATAAFLLGDAPAETNTPYLVKSGESIAFLGDSITALGSRPSGYVGLVSAGLRAKGIDVRIVPAGVFGETSAQMLARLDKDVIAKKPTWMTLSCGVNDVWKLRRGKGVRLEDYKRNVRTILDRVQAAGIRPIVFTATMIGDDPENETNHMLVPYNEFLREEAKARGVPLADQNVRMQQEWKRVKAVNGPRLTWPSDGVHMNWPGNVMLAEGVLETLGLNPKDASIQEAFLCQPDAVTLSLSPSQTELEALDALRQKGETRKQCIERLVATKQVAGGAVSKKGKTSAALKGRKDLLVVLGEKTADYSGNSGWAEMIGEGLSTDDVRCEVKRPFAKLTVKGLIAQTNEIAGLKASRIVLMCGYSELRWAAAQWQKTIPVLVNDVMVLAGALSGSAEIVVVGASLLKEEVKAPANERIFDYNARLKAACAERSIRFFDTSAVMVAAGTEGLISDSKLCMRFTYAGRVLLAKGVLGAFGRSVASETERIWKSYPGAENIEVGFSQKGYAELKRRAAAAGLRPQAYVEAIWR